MVFDKRHIYPFSSSQKKENFKKSIKNLDIQPYDIEI